MKSRVWFGLSLLVIMSLALAACGSAAAPQGEPDPTAIVVEMVRSRTPTGTEMPTMTNTATNTLVPTASRTQRATLSPVFTVTGNAAQSGTPTRLPTLTDAASATSSATATSTSTPTRLPTQTSGITPTRAVCSFNSLQITRRDLNTLETAQNVEVTFVQYPNKNFPYWLDPGDAVTFYPTQEELDEFRPVMVVNMTDEVQQGYADETLEALLEVADALTRNLATPTPYTHINLFAASVSMQKCGDTPIANSQVFDVALGSVKGTMLPPFVFWLTEAGYVLKEDPSPGQ